MDVTRESHHRLRRLAAWFEASPAELAGLLLLVAGAAAASVLLWLAAERRPDELPSTVRAIGVPVDPDRLEDLTAPVDPVPDEAASELTIHVTGAVARPGLVTVPAGARVGDAVAAAGGASPEADPERVNLARPVADGEHVHLPRRGEPEQAGGAAPAGAMTADGRIDINRASAAELETLPGIGPAKAAAIVAHREAHGPFGAPADLRAVRGIGEVTFQGIAEHVVVP